MPVLHRIVRPPRDHLGDLRPLVTVQGVPRHQGLKLVHYSAQLELFLTQKHYLNTPHTPYHPLNIPETTPNRTPCHTEGAQVELKSGRV